MTVDGILFARDTASADAILAHFSSGGTIREALLARGVDVLAYAEKLATRATTFEAWRDARLVGLVAAYLNDMTSGQAYISNVSVLEDEHGKGIASALLRTCLDEAAVACFDVVALETAKRNAPALALYERLGFRACGRDGEIVRMALRLPLAG